MKIQLALGESQFICGNVEEAKQRFEALVTKYPEPENLITIKSKYFNLYAGEGNFEKVIQLGQEVLAHLKYKLNSKGLIFNLVKSRLLYNDQKINRLKDASLITDQRLLHIMETLTTMGPAANRINDQMSAAIALKMAIISAKYGNCPYSPSAYAAYSYILFHILKDHKRGKKLENITLELLQQAENGYIKSIAYCILGAFINHWSHPLQDTINCLEKSIAAGPGEGEFLYSSYAITFAIITKYVAGAPLIEIKQYIDIFRSKEKRLEHYLTSFMFEIYTSHIHLLESGAPLGPGTLGEEDIKIDEEKEMFADTLILNREMIKLQRLYLEEKMPEAYCLTEEIAPRVSRHKGFVLNVDFTFYSILNRLAFHHFAALRMVGFSVKASAEMMKDLSWEWESAVNNLVVAGYRVDDAMSAVWDVYRDVIGAAIIMKMFSSVFTGSLFLDLARWQNLIIGGLKYAIKQSL